MWIDIHSHQAQQKAGLKRILSVEPADFKRFDTGVDLQGERASMSLGIHPWNALDWDLNSVLSLMDDFLNKKVLFIGEIGLDKSSTVPFSNQMLVFKTQLEMAVKCNKPVLLHVVRAMAETLQAKKEYPTIPAWVIHGFRGGKQEAEQYISKGFYLSFGPKFNKEGLLACPSDRLLLETDNSGVDINVVYELVEQVLQCTLEKLEKQIESNFSTLFDKQKDI